MADRIRAILEKLIAAIQTMNEVVFDDGVALSVRKSALLKLCAALRQVVDCQDLWQALYESASGRPPSADVPDMKACLESVAQKLCEAHILLLLKCGYRTPPPPSANELIEETRKSVLAENGEPRWGIKHAEEAQIALRTFVTEIDQRINSAGPQKLYEIGKRMRQTAIGAAFLTLLSQAEIKTGDSFSVDLSASLTDPVTLEITVPAPWAEGPLAKLMGSTVTIVGVDNLAKSMDSPFEGPATLEDLTPVEHPIILEHPTPVEDPFRDPFDL